MQLSLASIVMLLASVVSAQDAPKPNCHFQNIHYDRAMNVVDTFITAVNHNGSIVGGYDRLLQNGIEFRSSGFMHSNGTYFPIDVPWAKNTLPYSLNDRGEIVGVYLQSGVWKGFTLTAKGYAKISVPGFSSVIPSAINNGGMIVGTVDERHGSVLVEKGFTAKGGTSQLISFPGSSSTSLDGVNDEGTIVGSYGSPDGKTFHGLLLKNGIFNTLDYPGSTWTLLRSISNDGLVLGFYWIFSTSGPTITNNFIWKDGQFKVLPSDGSFNCFQSEPCPNATNFLDTDGQNKFVGSFYPPTLPPNQYTDGFVATCKDVF